MTVRTYGQLPYTVAVLGAAEVMRDQRILYVWLRPQAALERLSGVPQVCERRRRPTEVAKHCRPSDPLCQPEVGGTAHKNAAMTNGHHRPFNKNLRDIHSNPARLLFRNRTGKGMKSLSCSH